MPRTTTETSSFTVQEIFCFVSGVPILGLSSFANDKKIGEYVTGVPCPVTEEPQDGDIESLTLYALWCQTMQDYAAVHVQKQMHRQHPPSDILSDLPSDMPMHILPEQVGDVVKSLLNEAEELGIKMYYVLNISPLPSSLCKRIQASFKNPKYRKKRFEMMEKVYE